MLPAHRPPRWKASAPLLTTRPARALDRWPAATARHNHRSLDSDQLADAPDAARAIVPARAGLAAGRGWRRPGRFAAARLTKDEGRRTKAVDLPVSAGRRSSFACPERRRRVGRPAALVSPIA